MLVASPGSLHPDLEPWRSSSGLTSALGPGDEKRLLVLLFD